MAVCGSSGLRSVVNKLAICCILILFYIFIFTLLFPGLGGEFVTAIAYSIRGQLSWHQRTYAFR